MEVLLGQENLSLLRKGCKLLIGLINRSRKHDVVVGGVELHTTYLSVVAACIAGTPIIVLSHTELLKWIKEDRLTTFHKPISRIVYNFAKRVLAVSKVVSHHLQSKFGVPTNRLQVIYNPINIERLKCLAAQPPEWLPNDKRILVALGRLSPEKGFDVLIRAIGQLNLKKIHLIIMGEGALRSDLEKLVKDLCLEERIHLPGYIRNPYPILKRAAAFAFPSRYEGFGIALVEAMALGIPVVASRLPVLEEITLNGHCALLVDPENPEAFAKGLEQVLGDSNFSSHFVTNGRKRSKDFDIAKIAATWKTLINEICM